ncbi:MAG: class II aldolase/adducin family protein [Candidatus Bathyarchaeia archaeon]
MGEANLYDIYLWKKLMKYNRPKLNEDNIRLKIIEIGRRLFKEGVVFGTWGNLSARLDNNSFLITPSGFAKGELQPSDLLIVDLSGKVVKGNLRPSIETTLHAKIYKRRMDVGGIIHTHPTFCTSFAICMKEIPIVSVDAAAVIGEKIPVAKYYPPGSEELADEVVNILRDGVAVLLANHGLITVGKNLEEAYHAVIVAENEARILVFSHLIGTPKELQKEEIEALRAYYETKYGQNGKLIVRY